MQLNTLHIGIIKHNEYYVHDQPPTGYTVSIHVGLLQIGHSFIDLWGCDLCLYRTGVMV